MSIQSTLALSEFFYGLSDAHLDLIAGACELETYQKGQVLIQESERSDELYVIGDGAVEILINPALVADQEQALEHVVVAELRQGQAFGEMSLVDQGIRSATVRVSEDNTSVLRLSRTRLMKLCDEHTDLGYSLMKNLAIDLATKMRNTDLSLRQYELMLSTGK
jgi:CRP-like cAMP-binding protein